MEIFTVAFFSYLSGSIPFGVIFTKIFKKVDLRKIGSGNIGATNVLRTGNKSLAFAVLSLDTLKGFLPLIILKNFFLATNSEITIYLIASLTILGHIFPICLKFKGGKGVATYIGYLFAINYLLGLIFVFSWIIVARIKKYSSLASIVSLIILPFASILLFFENIIILLFFTISIIIISKQVPPSQSSLHIHCSVISSQLHSDDSQLFSQSSIHSYPSGQPLWKQPAGFCPGQEDVLSQ